MDYFTLIEDKLGREEAEALIEKKIDGFHGLLTKEAAAKLIASEMKLIEGKAVRISEICEGDQSIDIVGKVEEIGKLMEFPSGAKLRAIIISDESGRIPVNFWAEGAVNAGSFHLLDVIQISKAYMKMGKLNMGYKGGYSLVKREEAAPLNSISEKKERFSVMGKVAKIYGAENGKFSFEISDGKDSVPVVIEELAGRGAHLAEGDSVLLEGVVFSNGRIVAGGKARMLLRKNRDNIFRGNLDTIEFEGENAFISAGGERFALERSALVKFLNLKGLNEDIDLKMVSEMKVPEIKGRGVWILFKEKEGIKTAEQAELR